MEKQLNRWEVGSWEVLGQDGAVQTPVLNEINFIKKVIFELNGIVHTKLSIALLFHIE